MNKVSPKKRVSYYMARVELTVSSPKVKKSPGQIFDEIQEIEQRVENYLRSQLEAMDYEVEKVSKIFP